MRKMSISIHRCVGRFILLQGGCNAAVTDHVVVFPNDAPKQTLEKLVDLKLPRMLDENDIVMSFHGSKEEWEKISSRCSILPPGFKIRPSVIGLWLRMLKACHPSYRNVDCDVDSSKLEAFANRLNSWVEFQVVHSESALPDGLKRNTTTGLTSVAGDNVMVNESRTDYFLCSNAAEKESIAQSGSLSSPTMSVRSSASGDASPPRGVQPEEVGIGVPPDASDQEPPEENAWSMLGIGVPPDASDFPIQLSPSDEPPPSNKRRLETTNPGTADSGGFASRINAHTQREGTRQRV